MHSPVPHHSFIHSFAHLASRQRTPAGRLGTNVPRATAGHQGWRRRVARVSRTGAHTPCKPSSEQTHLSAPGEAIRTSMALGCKPRGGLCPLAAPGSTGVTRTLEVPGATNIILVPFSPVESHCPVSIITGVSPAVPSPEGVR